ncbi:hypothetical protein KJ688_09465 [bacterium]|nr:hypothetical protein [bacterium]
MRLIFILLFSLIFTLKAELNSQTIENPRSVLRVELLSPGLVFERRIKNNSTIVFDLGARITPTYSLYWLNPIIKIESRIYINSKKRRISGKRTDYYSGQYIGLQVGTGKYLNGDTKWCSIGPIWGFQRTLYNKWYWNIGLGPGIGSHNNETNFSVVGGMGIGLIIK